MSILRKSAKIRLFPAKESIMLAVRKPKPVRDIMPTIIPDPATTGVISKRPFAEEAAVSNNPFKVRRSAFRAKPISIVEIIAQSAALFGDACPITKAYINTKSGISKYPSFLSKFFKYPFSTSIDFNPFAAASKSTIQ